MATAALTRDQVCERVKQVLAQELNLRPEELLPTAHFEKDLGADSLDCMEIVLSLQQEFGISIPDEDLHSLHTLQDTMEYVHRRLDRS